MKRWVVALLLVVVGGVTIVVLSNVDFCDGKDVTVFLDPDVDQEERAAVRAEIEKAESDIEYVDQAEAYEEFRELFRDSPSMLEDIEPSDLPPSYRVTVDDDTARTVRRGVEDLPGVRDIFTAPCGKSDELRRDGRPAGRD